MRPEIDVVLTLNDIPRQTSPSTPLDILHRIKNGKNNLEIDQKNDRPEPLGLGTVLSSRIEANKERANDCLQEQFNAARASSDLKNSLQHLHRLIAMEFVIYISTGEHLDSV